MAPGHHQIWSNLAEAAFSAWTKLPEPMLINYQRGPVSRSVSQSVSHSINQSLKIRLKKWSGIWITEWFNLLRSKKMKWNVSHCEWSNLLRSQYSKASCYWTLMYFSGLVQNCSILQCVSNRLSVKNFCSPCTTLRSFSSMDHFGIFVHRNAYRSWFVGQYLK